MALEERTVEIHRLLATEDLRYQKITFDDGISTEGNDRAGTADAIFPDSLAGKSVLDVGCNYGYFCFEAAHRGATHVVGLDFDPDSIRKATKIGKIKGIDVQFRLFDADRDQIDGKFNYVLCLNLLHHLRDPIAALDRLIASAEETLVIETPLLSRKSTRKIFNAASWRLLPGFVTRLILGRAAVIVVGTGRKYFEATFFLTPEALRCLLEQRGCFRSIRLERSPYGNRFICIAEKAEIDELLMIAGPSCAGKSTLIKAIIEGKEPALERELSSNQTAAWQTADATRIATLLSSRAEKILFQYNIMRPWLNGPNNYRLDYSLNVLECAKKVRTVTLLTAQSDLLARWQQREIEPRTRKGKYRGRRRKLKPLKAYQTPGMIVHFYDNWFDYLAHLPGTHSILDTRQLPYRLQPLGAWRELRTTL
ncbi:MAG TPA: methyltransferase domain-containing protein [Alphaproteobacteria bacterium]|nr:methyltransferase domain-containing protein [Alphaproteobacteria bacterium]